MRDEFRFLSWILALALTAVAQEKAVPKQDTAGPPAGAAEAKPRPKPPVLLKIQAGDLDGDGRAEVVTWDSEGKELTISSITPGGAGRKAGRRLENYPSVMRVADLDGDGKGELVLGEGLRGYNPKEGPQTDARLVVHQPLARDGWAVEEIFRGVTERPDFTSIEVADLDGDGAPEILFAYFASKYQIELRVARRRGTAWETTKLQEIRMGMHVAAAPLQSGSRPSVVVGRPYGEKLGLLGDAFILEGDKRVTLPVFRGVSAIAVADMDGDGRAEVVAGDGWHQDYGKIARARLALMRYTGSAWAYELIEDLPQNTRIRQIQLADLDGDGRPEIIAQGERRNSLGGDVRLYQRTPSGWRGTTLAEDVQGFALGRFQGGKKLEAVFTGAPHRSVALDLASARWDEQLAEPVLTYEVKSAELVDKPAPPLRAREWIGSESLSLEQLRGKVVLVDFWATWCKPCIASFPAMREWLAKYGPRGLAIVGLTNHSSQTSEDVRAFLGREKLPWPVGIDPDSRVHMDYGVSPIPHTFLIDRQGTLRMSHVGGGKPEEIEKRIVALLGE